MPEHTIAENLTRLQNAKTAIGAAITAKGGTVAAGDGLEEFAADIGTITNQYSAADEGKVVSSGALVAQTAYPSTITENGTYNTTENNSVTVNVATGLAIHQLSTTSGTVSNSNIKYLYYNKVLYIFGTLTSQFSSGESFNFESQLSNIGITSSATSYIYSVSTTNYNYVSQNLTFMSTKVNLPGTSGQPRNVIGVFQFS